MFDALRNWFPTNADRSRLDQVLFRLAWVLYLFLPVFLGYALLKGDWSDAVGNLVAIAIAFLPRWVDAQSRFRFPALGELALALILAVEMAGRTFNLYERNPIPYDLFAHAVEAGAITSFAVLLLYAFLLDHEVDYDGWFVVGAGILIGLGIGAGWEIIEWLASPFFSGRFQHGLGDTMSDLAAGAVGALFGTLATTAYKRAHSREEIAGEIEIFYQWF